MGIRYFARPVPPDLVAIAQINPGAFLDDANFWPKWARPATGRCMGLIHSIG